VNILAQGRFWRASSAKNSVVLVLQKASLPEDVEVLRDFRIEVPLTRWNRLIKNLSSNRKLLGGLLLDFASKKDLVSVVIGNDRLLAELRTVALDATAALVEEELLVLSPSDGAEDDS
jgi:hypothetical protein